MLPNCKNLNCKNLNRKYLSHLIASIFALALLLGSAPLVATCAAQTSVTPGPINEPPLFPGQPRPIGANSEPGVPPRIAAAAARARENERQKRLVADSDKLLALATELHADVARTDKNILSVDVIHRADEIEKLAHSVKERMKGQQ